jgi:hypothetical protein
MSEVSKPVPAVVSRAAAQLRRLGRNVNGYLGESINIGGVLREIDDAARRHQWESETFLDSPRLKLKALHRAPAPRTTQHAPRIYLSAGIHGDEPAGPLAVLQLLQEDRWPPDFELWLCPCLNPAGFALNRRENAEGVDLNRQYLQPKADETLAHIDWLKRQPPFDLCLCLHEDWEAHGFYVYELNPDNQPSLAEAIVNRVAEACPVDHSEIIEGRPAQNGIIRPSVDPRARPQWPESFFLLTHKTRLSYTLEAPSDFPLAVRTGALVAAVNAGLDSIAADG